MRKIFLINLFLIILLSEGVLAITDIGYVVKSYSDLNVINAINDLGLSYDIIDQYGISSAEFSDYKIILVGDGHFSNYNNIPVNEKNSLVMNTYHLEDWKIAEYSGSIVSNQYLDGKIVYSNSINYGFSSPIQIYDTSGISANTIPKIPNRAAGLKNILATNNFDAKPLIGVIYTGGELYGGGISDSRIAFFGITEADYWTSETEQLFKNTIMWILNGEDKDGDGFFTEEDCDDSNFYINPNATEIPYDGIDQDCDGSDLTDVDGDEYDAEIVGGNDCDDNDASINPGSNDSLKNCINEPPIFSGPIYDLIWDEDDNSSIVNLSDYFSDPENDDLSFEIYDTSENENITLFFLSNWLIEFESEENWYGNDWIIFSASDGELNTITNNISLIVNPINDAPILEEINNIVVSEGDLIEIIANATDPDNDILSYSIDSLKFTDNEDGNFTWRTNYNDSGIYHITINVSDGKIIDSETIDIIVNNLNRAPILEDIENQITLEDTAGSVLANATDLDNDSLIYTIINENVLEIDCDVNGNNITFIPASNWYGNTSCGVNVNDNNGGTDSKIFYIEVQPVNDAPILNEINNVIVSKGDLIEIIAHANDVDGDTLTYSINDTTRFTNNGNGNFTWQTDYSDVGDYIVNISVSDGDLIDFQIVSIRVSNTNQLPIIFIENQTIPEDSGIHYTNIISSDPDGSIVAYNVVSENTNKVDCETIYTDHLLRFEPAKDFEGTAYCKIEAVDNSGGRNFINVEFEVTNINDAPKIKSYSPTSPVKILEGNSKTFSVVVKDIDNPLSDIITEWAINGNSFIGGNSYVFNKPKGNYGVSVNVSDGFLYDSFNWEIVVGNISDFSCSEMNGHICSEGEICPGSFLGIYDSGKCCNVACIPGPPSFNDVDMCENPNSNIKIKIKDPDSGDEFEIGDVLKGEIKIENELEEDKDFEIEIYLYDLTEDEEIEDFKDNIGIDKGEDEEIEFEIEIPDDIEKNSDYYIYVIVRDEDNETLCNQKYEKIEIERPDSKIIIKNTNVIGSSKAGSFMDVEIEIENLGEDKEDVYVIMESDEIGAYKKEGPFEIEEYDEDNYLSRIFSMEIPKETEEGTYMLDILAQGDESEDSKTIEFKITKPSSYSLIGDEIILGQGSYPTQIILETTSQTDTGNVIFVDSQKERITPEKGEIRMYIKKDSQKSIKDKMRIFYSGEKDLENILLIIDIFLIIGIIIEIILIFIIKRRR